MAQASGPTNRLTKQVGQSLGALGHFLGILFNPPGRVRHGQRFLTLMEGGSFDAILAAFEAHPDGQALLKALPDTEGIISDRNDLSRRPAGSFGRCYLDFLVPNGFDASDYSVIAKKAAVGFSIDPKRTWLRDRIDGIHDVRHVMTGYGADQLGEACLLAFRVGQIGHPGAAILATMVGITGSFIHGPLATLKALKEGYLRGRSAVLVDLCPIEFDLSEPLESYRAKLGLTPPLAYQALIDRHSQRKLRRLHRAKAVGREPAVQGREPGSA